MKDDEDPAAWIWLGDGRRVPNTPVADLKGQRLDLLEDATGMTLADIDDTLTGLNDAAAAGTFSSYVVSRRFRHAFGAAIWSSRIAAGDDVPDYWSALEDVALGQAIAATMAEWWLEKEEGEPDPTQADAPSAELDPDSSTASESAST